MKEDKARLEHIIDAIRQIETLEQRGLLADPDIVAAAMYHITVIGEAANHVSDSLKQDYPDIPWGDITGMRNRLIHEYFDTDMHIVRDTLAYDIPRLKQWINDILKQM